MVTGLQKFMLVHSFIQTNMHTALLFPLTQHRQVLGTGVTAIRTAFPSKSLHAADEKCSLVSIMSHEHKGMVSTIGTPGTGTYPSPGESGKASCKKQDSKYKWGYAGEYRKVIWIEENKKIYASIENTQ